MLSSSRFRVQTSTCCFKSFTNTVCLGSRGQGIRSNFAAGLPSVSDGRLIVCMPQNSLSRILGELQNYNITGKTKVARSIVITKITSFLQRTRPFRFTRNIQRDQASGCCTCSCFERFKDFKFPSTGAVWESSRPSSMRKKSPTKRMLLLLSLLASVCALRGKIDSSVSGNSYDNFLTFGFEVTCFAGRPYALSQNLIALSLWPLCTSSPQANGTYSLSVTLSGTSSHPLGIILLGCYRDGWIDVRTRLYDCSRLLQPSRLCNNSLGLSTFSVVFK